MKLDSKVRVIPLMVFCVMGFLSLFSVKGSDVFQITTDSPNQYNPAIYESIVVWEDLRNGNKDIYGYDMSTQEEFPICTDPRDQSSPVIYGDIVVWEDTRNRSNTCEQCRDIYGYNMSTQEEFPICTDPHDQSSPAIYGDVVVWQDERNHGLGIWGNTDIYGYNLSTKQEVQITTDTEDQYSPAIYGDIIVWTDERDVGSAIYGYNLSTGQEFLVATRSVSNFPYPVIYEDTIIWGEMWFDTRTIDGYNLSESKRFRIFRDFVWECQPEYREGTRLAIYGDIVVWVDYRDCNRDISGYNLSTHQEFLIAFQYEGEYSPAVYGDIVVWVHESGGKTDIYGRNISSGVIPVSFTYRKKVILLYLFCGILAVFPTFVSVVVGSYVERIISERMGSPEKPRDFRRSSTSLVLFGILAVLSFLYGLHSIINDLDGVMIMVAKVSVLSGFFWVILSGLFVYLAFWSRRTPFIRITNDEIVILGGRTSRKVIERRDIKNIDFKDDKVELISSSDIKFTIPLDRVDRRDKEALIEALKHSPEVSSYS